MRDNLPRSAGFLFVLLSALGFGLMPVLAVFAYRGGINVITMLWIRFSAAAAVLLLALGLRRRLAKTPAMRTSRADAMRLPPGRILALLAVLGVCYALQSGLYLSAVRHIPVSLATLILYFYPALVCLSSPLVERRPLGGRDLLALAVAFAGLVLVLGASFRGFQGPGIWLAIGAAGVYSVYIHLSNRVLRRVEPLPFTAFVTLVSAGCFLLGGLAAGSLEFRFAPVTLLPLLGIILFSTLLAILAFLKGLERLGPGRTAILSMTEPLFSILLSTLLFAERLTPRQAVGGACLLAGVTLATLRGQPESKEAGRAGR